MTSPDPWSGFLDAALPPTAPYVGRLRVPDTELPETASDWPLLVVVTGGAGQLAGPVDLCRRRELWLTGLEAAVRDLSDPAGNARRIVAAADAAGLGGSESPVSLQVQVADRPTPAWLAAVDELAAAGHRLVLDLDGPDLEAWIDAALDRETAFSLRGGTVEQAVEAVRTTARLWGDPDDLAAGRRWCRSWACPTDQVAHAVGHLAGLTA
ncbi:MAG: hypothetical protein JWN84_2363 [Nocardioides sp.]|nr:hypothetical protein [Nocardioides sp.]